jgi:hypothetical protein
LAGKLIGVFGSVVFQLLLLMLALTLVGSLLQGTPVFIWGENIWVVALVLISVSTSVSGLGMLLEGLVKSPEQAQVFSSVLNMGLAVLGGAFGFQLPGVISQFSLIYWGRDAFDTLAAGGVDVNLNLLILVLQGLAMFIVGLVLFQRKFEV